MIYCYASVFASCSHKRLLKEKLNFDWCHFFLFQAADKIGVLHEIVNQETRKMANNVEALFENIDGNFYITFKNEQNEPLLIFSRDKAAVKRITRPSNDKPQLLLRIISRYYILTFANSYVAKEFGDDLLQYVKVLHMGHVFAETRVCFLNNQITIDS